MDVVKFCRARNRMCDHYKYCRDCPAYETNCTSISEISEKLVEVVEQWSEDHPPKTILQDFLEKYPNAQDDIYEQVCPYKLGYKMTKHCGDMSCYDCWNQPMEE